MVVTRRCLPALSFAVALGFGAVFGADGSAAQQPAPTPSSATQLAPPAAPLQLTGRPARIRTIQQSPGLPETEVSCRGLHDAEKASVQCLVRFNSPINVATVLATNPASRSERWTAYFQPFDPARDDTAFYVLVETTGPRRATTIRQSARDLGAIFSRIGPNQRVAVAGFSTELDQRTNFTSNRDAIGAAFEGIRQNGQATELYRQALAAIQRLEQLPAGRRILVIAGTGRADDTAANAQEVEAAAARAGVRIVTLGYAERDADAPAIQTLERLSALSHGASYRIRDRELPAAFANTILTRYGAGGFLEASLPGGALPNELDITINHPDNRSSVFAAVFTNSADGPAPEGDAMTSLSTANGYVEEVIDFLSRDALRTGLIALGALVLLALLAYAFLRRKPRPGQAGATPSSVPPAPPVSPQDLAPQNLAPQNLAPQSFAAQDVAPREAFREEPAPPHLAGPAPTAHHEDQERLHVTPAITEVIVPPSARAPAEEAERPVLAYLEFNGPPDRVEMRKPFIIIGREEEGVDVVVPETYRGVSRGHVAISLNTSGRFQINNRSPERRPDSPNPIFVNGNEVVQVELSDGDTIKLGYGTYGFVFRIAPPA